ncbi:hypothetical protein [Blastococcus brunescens]|uniref:Uncharacterized protein n=1 Tax=Blastococcus brunescens TaxID=1564165 RepID=A0ABZ1B3U6_9ACTN|nr:hypothetical protein [Blastococcus sp. BMG 8361]WRL65484.1 hypothetical protein U6N30_07680 [Blastococcus sp. BMG 8361]
MTAPDPARAGRALAGAAAGVLVLEGLAVLFVPRGIAQTGEGSPVDGSPSCSDWPSSSSWQRASSAVRVAWWWAASCRCRCC